MGLYLLNAGEHPVRGKVDTLIQKHHARRLTRPPADFSMIQPGEYLVCVVDNGAWEAAGIAYDERQFNRFTQDRSGRKMTWLMLDAAVVEKLCPPVLAADREGDID